mmetsp:Transcript_67879/g.129140  ORF Transcript_67879/g.129140 Transcript_67879/m.129140 type:complete len:105 (+) Transcript_67879:84-398(+)
MPLRDHVKDTARSSDNYMLTLPQKLNILLYRRATNANMTFDLQVITKCQNNFCNSALPALAWEQALSTDIFEERNQSAAAIQSRRLQSCQYRTVLGLWCHDHPS